MLVKKVDNFTGVMIWFCVLIYVYSTPTESIRNSDSWGTTQINISKTVFDWTIDNFNATVFTSSEFIDSPIFYGVHRDHQWQITLWPNYNVDYTGNLLIRLYLKKNGWGKTIDTTFRFALRGVNDRIEYNRAYRVSFNSVDGYQSDYIDRKKIDDTLKFYKPDDKLTIRVEIIEKHGIVMYQNACNPNNTKLTAENFLLDSFETLLKEELFSDVKLVVDNQEFQVHRAILARLSPVFSNLFKQNLDKRVFNITDVNPVIFKEVLRFIYTGKVEHIDEIANKILPVADTYEIKLLAELCEIALCRNLNDENALDTLTLADIFNSQYLKAQASNYIAANALKISESTSFRAMEFSHPHPIMRIFRLMMTNYKSSK